MIEALWTVAMVLGVILGFLALLVLVEFHIVKRYFPRSGHGPIGPIDQRIHTSRTYTPRRRKGRP